MAVHSLRGQCEFICRKDSRAETPAAGQRSQSKHLTSEELEQPRLYLLPSVLLERPRVGAGSLTQLVLWPAGTYHHLIVTPSSPVEDGITLSGFLGRQPGSLAASEAPWDGKSGSRPDIINNYR